MLSSHVLSEVAEIADQLVILGSGRVRLTGALDELLERALPAHRAGRPAGVVGSGAIVESQQHAHLVRGPARTGRRLARGAPEPRGHRPRLPDHHRRRGSMIWVTWRQHRTTILAAVGSVLLLTVVAAARGLIVRAHEQPGRRSATSSAACPVTAPRQCWAESTLTMITPRHRVLPVLLGLLVGITVFSRDIERGTHVLGLSQSVSRRTWYWTRVLVVFVPVAAAVAVLGSALEWARTRPSGRSHLRVDGGYGGTLRSTVPLFQSTGHRGRRYTFLALVLGSCVGTAPPQHDRRDDA